MLWFYVVGWLFDVEDEVYDGWKIFCCLFCCVLDYCSCRVVVYWWVSLGGVFFCCIDG